MVVVTVMATALAPGAVSFLYFADRLAQLPLGLIGVAISTALLPIVARRMAEGRLEEARVAYVAGDLERGDSEMSLAVRLDPALAADGVSLIEPTLGAQPAPERLLLYGDLLNASGREAEATRAYDLAADRRSRATST